MSQVIKVGKPTVSAEDGYTTISSEIEIGGKNERVWYKCESRYIDQSYDYSSVFLIMILQIAMARGESVVVEGGVSERLLAGISTAQEIFNRWYPEQQKMVEVIPNSTITDEAIAENQKKETASFFSSGVDSFYTVERHSDEIKNLVFVYGFDIRLPNEEFFSKVSKHLRDSAKALGKNLIIVETNLRDIADPYVSWPDHYHGSAMGSVSVLLGGFLDKVYISASQVFEHFRPYGSNLLTDGLWATEGIEIVYDGYTDTRFEKIVQIANNRVAQKHLRVCWESNDAYNCSVCEKCTRTMMSLEAVGVLGIFKTFTKSLNYESIANADIGDRSIDSYAVPPYTYLKKHGRVDSNLGRALRELIDKTTDRNMIKSAHQAVDYFLESNPPSPAEMEVIDRFWDQRTKRMLAHVPKAIANKIVKKMRLL